MRIYFSKDMVTIEVNDKDLSSYTLEKVLKAHTSRMLMLENSIILLSSASTASTRERFLIEVGKIYADKYNYNSQFFINALQKLKLKTIKLNIVRTCKSNMTVSISYAGKYHINISLDTVAWLAEYFYELLKPYTVKLTSKILMLDITDEKAITNLQKIISKKMMFGYNIKYKYYDGFFDTISEFYMHNSCNNQSINKTILESYALLNCRIGSSKEALKSKYRQLAKAYHPDRAFTMQYEDNYTARFQHLQNAYTTLTSALF